MHFSKNMIVKISLTLFLLGLILVGCKEDSTPLIPPVDDSAIEISFPIGKKAIYARGDYLGDNPDSLTEMFLTIYSLQFDTAITKDNATEYIGSVERYSSPFFANDSLPGRIFPEYYGKGRILVTVDEKWVLFQNSEIADAALIFMKRNSALSDTTDFPNWLYGQLPVFPKSIAPNTMYEIVRPGDGDMFLEYQRDFEIMDYIEWSDIYGSDNGLHFSTEYSIKFENDLTLNFSGIIDEKGIVLSRTIIENFVTAIIDNPAGVDTTSLHLINRRIVDFTNPEYTHELSWYADYVKENGLHFLKDD